MNIVPGQECIINSSGDLMFDGDKKRFIGKTCVIIKRCKSGLIEVHRKDAPNDRLAFRQRNIDLIPQKENMDKQTVTIAITGRPASGKTAIMQAIGKALKEAGFEVDLLPYTHEKLYAEDDLADALTALPSKTRVELLELGISPSTTFITNSVNDRRSARDLRDMEVSSRILMDTLAVPQEAFPVYVEAAVVPRWTEHTKHLFIASEKRLLARQGDETFETLPLKIGVKCSLLGVSTSQAGITSGSMDHTDAISEKDAVLRELVFLTSSGQYVSVPLGDGSVSRFSTDQPGYARRDHILATAFSGKTVISLQPDTLDIFGDPLTGDTWSTLEVDFSVTGLIHQHLGDVQIDAGITQIRTVSEGVEVVPSVYPLAIVGYQLSLRRTNPNRRPID